MTNQLRDDPDPANLLRTVLSDFDLEILETTPIEYRCYCSRERTEREIEKLEGQLAALDAESEANATDYQKLMEIDARKQALNAQLEALYEAWEALCE